MLQSVQQYSELDRFARQRIQYQDGYEIPFIEQSNHVPIVGERNFVEAKVPDFPGEEKNNASSPSS
jgi:hypothetical protein